VVEKLKCNENSVSFIVDEKIVGKKYKKEIPEIIWAIKPGKKIKSKIEESELNNSYHELHLIIYKFLKYFCDLRNKLSFELEVFLFLVCAFKIIKHHLNLVIFKTRLNILWLNVIKF